MEAQARRGFCGPATASAVIDAALAPRLATTQAPLFTASTATIRGELAVSFGGPTLEELARCLRAHGLQVDVFHAGATDLAAFRDAARHALHEPRTFLVVDDDRKMLRQADAGRSSRSARSTRPRTRCWSWTSRSRSTRTPGFRSRCRGRP